NVCSELSDKLADLWLRNHSQQILLPLSETFFVGNSNIENAEVIGIGQLFSDPNNSKFCGKILSQHYREGDIILIEGIDAGKRVHRGQNPQTDFLTKPAEMYGWEPVGYEALNAQVFETAITIENQFKACSILALKLINNHHFLFDPLEFERLFPRDNSLSSNPNRDSQDLEISQIEKDKIWQELFTDVMERLLKTMYKIENYASDSHTPDSVNNFTTHPENTQVGEFKKNYQIFQQSQKRPEDCTILAKSLQSIFTSCLDAFQKSKYRNKWTAIQNNFFRDTWDVRQNSLLNEIENYRGLGKRVLVCAGAAHFFPNKGKIDSAALSALKQHKFTIGLSNIKENATYYSFDELSKNCS
ncbi:MAG TPA: hypothetical protein VGP47_05755, partial [Parachlamydiaceae bacterium]|nr:hypothetical protein [Parachlamydiaceae bacterium]